VKVDVAWCDPGHVDGLFAESIVRLILHGTMTGKIRGFQRVHSGPVLDQTRNKITRKFLKGDADWLLMIDSDMSFEPDLLDQLLEIADPDERPIVGPLCYSVNHDGVFPVAYLRNGEQYGQVSNPPENELIQVSAVGAACLLIHRSALEAIEGVDMPGEWWDRLFLGEKPLGEDMAFMLRAEMAGVPVHIHTGIPIGHVKWKLTVDHGSFIKWRTGHRFVITGTGRCGTGYLAQLFRAMEIPCGHESIYTPLGPQDWTIRRADSSWLAAPFLKDLQATVIHLVRNPLDVLNSFMGIGFFDDEADEHGHYRQFAELHCPEAFTEDTPLERACRFIVLWNAKIEPHRDVLVRVEDMRPAVMRELMHLVGSDAAIDFVEANFDKVPTDINSRRRATYTWDDTPEWFRRFGSKLGYEVPR
jgi:hypothetical protein